jgi:protein O-mannosyl-transferase
MKSVLTSVPQSVLKYLTGMKVHYYIILAVIPAIVYLQTVKFGYSGFDDEEIIARKMEFIQKAENLPLAFKRDAFMNSKGDSFYRPVGNISFMIDAIIGGDNVSVFHAHNIILHILSLLLALYLFSLMGLDKRISFMVLLILSIHPLFTHAVCWIPARMDLLLAVFTICSFITFIKYVSTGNKVYIFIHYFFFFLAVFSKETALLLPVIFGIYYLLLGEKNYKKISIGFLPGWIFIEGVFLIMRFQVLQSQQMAGNFNLLLFFKNLQVIPTIPGKFIVPVGLTTMPHFQLFFVLLGIGIILGLIAFMLLKKPQGTWVLLFGILWYVILSVPPLLYTNPMSAFGSDYLEHRAYVPMLGIAMCICYLLRGKTTFTGYRKIFVAIVVVVLSAITYSNSFNYASPLDFYSAAIRENPESAMAYNSRSMYKYSAGDVFGAESDLNASLAITTKYAPAWNNKAALFLNIKQYDSAIVCLNKALNINDAYADAYVNRAIARTNLGDLFGALKDYKKSIRFESSVDYVHFNLGNIYAIQGMYENAIKEYSDALVLNPNYLEALNNRANISLRLKRFQDALGDCNKLIAIKPDYQRAYYNQSKTYMGLGMYSEALEAINNAISIDSSYLAAIEYRSLLIQKRAK